MASYISIIKEIIKTKNNVFRYNYKDDGVEGIFKIYFNMLIQNNITIKNKYKFFIDTLNNFCIKGMREEKFINFFCKIQKTYNLLNRLDKDKCPLQGVDDEDLTSRATKMITNALALGVPDVVNPKDITTGNVRVNTLFVSYIFNTKHGLEELT